MSSDSENWGEEERETWDYLLPFSLSPFPSSLTIQPSFLFNGMFDARVGSLRDPSRTRAVAYPTI
jgi:hypothetical protein